MQAMIQDGVDTLVGVASDPTYGPLVAFGLGGVMVELLDDVAFRLAPLTAGTRARWCPESGERGA